MGPACAPADAADAAERPALRVAFVLAPRFTLTAFAGFVDALRLAADDGDRSRPRRCRWDVLGDAPIVSSCGVEIMPTAGLDGALDAGQGDGAFGYDCVVVVGGLLHGGQAVPARAVALLRAAAARGVRLVGLCTGSFVLARAGLLDGHLACVSWFHREEFEREFPHCRVVGNQMFVIDRDRLTCAGGTSVVHLAAAVIERALDRASAVKALRILIEDEPLPSRTLQPEAVLTLRSKDTRVRKAMLRIEQRMNEPGGVVDADAAADLGRRQLERRFRADVGLSPAQYRRTLRLERGRWLLRHTDLAVTEIALQCGFQDAGGFARAMRRAFGASPRALRAAGDGPPA